MTRGEILSIRSLADRQGRQESGLFAVEGAKMVGEALTSGFRVHGLYATTRAAERWQGATVVSGKEMERISTLRTPSDVVALVELPSPTGSRTDAGLALALDGVQDPGNMGTIIRLADWFGVGEVVCSPSSADCYAPKAVQATMGAIFRVNVRYVDLAPWLASQNRQLFGTFLDGENIYGARLPSEAVVVMGSEGRGVSPEVEALITRRLHIPPYPADAAGSESLNVAVATGIVCSEFRRR
ncbi:MAG: RNA methyltransferase [Rikenellaceae bacterium]|nr:RNA methyltransferase [Rikenellaceae bacterium]